MNSTREVLTLIILFIPSFYELVSTLKHCMSRFVNMWVLGSSWWGRNLLPFIQTFGVTTTLCLYCYAMLVDVDWFERIHERCESYYYLRKLKVATLIHIWVDWLGHPGAPSGLPGHLENPVLGQGDPVVPVWSSYGMPHMLKGTIRSFMLETSVCSHMLLWALA